jgi:glycosyl transferase family 25
MKLFGGRKCSDCLDPRPLGSSTSFLTSFPYRVCINLDRRPERWQRMESRFAAFNLGPVERISAIDGFKVPIPSDWPESPGAYGCLQSHLLVVRRARAEGRESVLIIEDDVLLDERFHEKFNERVQNLPENWDMLFFGCLHHDPPVSVASGIGRLRGSFSTFMYVVRHTAFDAFIRLNSRAKQAVDRNNTILQRLFNCYCFLPHLAWVDDSYSDAQGLRTRHWYIKESMVLRGKEVETMEKQTALIIPYRGGNERSLRNLRYLAGHYGALFEVLVVELDDHQSLDRTALPANCDYRFLKAEGNDRTVESVGSLAVGLKRYQQQKDYFIFNEGNVVCSRMEMRANLVKCGQYDMVSSFESYIDLNQSDSDRLMEGQSLATEDYLPRPRRSRSSEYFTVTKSALRALVEYFVLPVASQEVPVLPGLRIFDSPGSALCLFPGDGHFARALKNSQLTCGKTQGI